MKITKKKINILKCCFIALWLSVLCSITALLELSLLNFALLILASPTLIWMVLKIIVPFLKKQYWKTKDKVTSDDILKSQRRINRKKGLKDYSKATWNIEGIEIWATNESNARRKYHNDTMAKELRKNKLPSMMKKSVQRSR